MARAPRRWRCSYGIGDRGFDLEAVAQDRMGIRESILGRMKRHGGRATIRTGPGDGTEVRLELRRD
jgi:signal transduction histidine kinase